MKSRTWVRWTLNNLFRMLAVVAVFSMAIAIIGWSADRSDQSLGHAALDGLGEAILLAGTFLPGLLVYLFALSQLPRSWSSIALRIVAVSLPPIPGALLWYDYWGDAFSTFVLVAIILPLAYGLVVKLPTQGGAGSRN